MTSTTSSWTPIIGFIGLGNMGANMARCLQKAGYRLVVHDLHDSTAEDLVEHGAAWSPSAADCARRCELLITSLPKPDDSQLVKELAVLMTHLIRCYLFSKRWVASSAAARWVPAMSSNW